MAYAFRPVVRDDFPMLEVWLEAAEVRAWWGEPATEIAGMREDIADTKMTMLIVSHDGVPFAYAQHYEVHEWPQPHLAALPAGARAIDAFIGEAAMLGCGHGSVFLRELAASLRAGGVPIVAIDPGVDNLRARKAYANAGFRGDAIVATAEGPVVLMLYE